MKTVYPLILISFLNACSQSNDAAEASVAQPDFRQVFIQSCVESASGSPLPSKQVVELCACTHDKTAATYGSPAQWQQAMDDYDHKRSDPADLENRMRQAAAQCQTALQVTASEPAHASDSTRIQP